MSLEGIVVPMLTPLTADEQLDRKALNRFVDFLISTGVHGLFVLGSNGEGAALPTRIRQQIVEATVEAAGGRVPVIAGAPEIATTRVLNEIQALRNRGLQAYVITAPLYFKGHSDAELLHHFRRVADAADLPILLYDIPQFTGVPLSASLVDQAARLPNVIGLKDSSGDWEKFQQTVLHRPDGFMVFQGFQPLSAVSLLLGADGLIPGYANVYPKLFLDMTAAVQRRELESVFKKQRELEAFNQLRGRAGIHATKVIAQALGFMTDAVTAPLPRMPINEVASFLDQTFKAGLPRI